jgi:hypothetical protein
MKCREGFDKKILYVFINTCCHALEKKEIEKKNLAKFLDVMASPGASLHDVLREEDPERVRKALNRWYKTTKKAYFLPSNLIK